MRAFVYLCTISAALAGLVTAEDTKKEDAAGQTEGLLDLLPGILPGNGIGPGFIPPRPGLGSPGFGGPGFLGPGLGSPGFLPGGRGGRLERLEEELRFEIERQRELEFNRGPLGGFLGGREREIEEGRRRIRELQREIELEERRNPLDFLFGSDRLGADQAAGDLAVPTTMLREGFAAQTGSIASPSSIPIKDAQLGAGSRSSELALITAVIASISAGIGLILV
ncbi:hypothetical protein HIM_07338 [Hirsutella minnesotensis 3608]|uniref:Uncharacterized protein n=1 Tax=Hirsutella minnesotensis 3608 TaxID=1043627 RepID=A0A0F8A4C4_9HYPO|nr:hypothetical protein HIM_07338 [Hirsutella minnesotensis 3608]